MHPRTSRRLFLGLFLALLAAPAAAQNGDPWPMAGGDAGHVGTAPGPGPPYREAWSVDLREGDGDAPIAAPVAGRELIALVTEERVVALDPERGDLLWETPREAGGAGPAALTDDLLLFASGRGEEATLVAVGREDGEEVWRTDIGSVAAGGVTVDGDTAFVGTRGAEVVAVDLGSGEERWRFETMGAVEGPPSVDGDLVVATAQDFGERTASLHAVDAGSGQERWSLPVENIVGRSSAPAVLDEESIVFGGGDLAVRSVRRDDGQARWESFARAPFSDRTAPAVPTDVIASDALGHVYRLDAATGEERWLFRVPGTVVTGSPAVVGDAVIVADGSGQLSAIDLDRGVLVWRHQIGEEETLLVGAAPAGERIVAASEQGSVVAFEPDPSAPLLEEPSPTTLFLGTALLNFAGAFAVTVFVLAGVFGLIRRWRDRGEEA